MTLDEILNAPDPAQIPDLERHLAKYFPHTRPSNAAAPSVAMGDALLKALGVTAPPVEKPKPFIKRK